MIDTVAIRISCVDDNVRFLAGYESLWSPSKNIFDEEKLKKDASFYRVTRYPTKAEKSRHTYPRLTLYSLVRGEKDEILETGIKKVINRLNFLRVEFSAPKIIFNNNFDELNETQFDLLVDTLYLRLKEMGVIIKSLDLIANADVVTIHYSKNFVLPPAVLCSSLLRELYKSLPSFHFDHAQTDYRNGGHLIRFHQNTLDIALYDKKYDLLKGAKSDKRAFESDCAGQLILLDEFEGKMPNDVLRYEVRLGNLTRIKSEFKKVGTELKDFKFRTLFSERKSMDCLNYYWSSTLADLRFGSLEELSPQRLLEEIHEKHSELSFRKKVELAFYYLLFQDRGRSPPRRFLESCGLPKSAWSRLKKETEIFSEFDPSSNFKHIKSLTKQLEEYTPLRLEDFSISKFLT